MPTRVNCQAWTDPIQPTSLDDILSGKALEQRPQASDANTQHWFVPIPEGAHWLQTCMELLTKPEKERADRFRHEGARQQFLASHATVHAILRHYLGNDYKHVQWLETEHHKPFIRLPDSSRRIEYNLSHSEGFIAVAVGTNSQGIDIERHRYLEDLEGISRQVFTDSEIAQVFASRDAGQQHATFYKFWTCKEAALKADGTGFMKDPKTLELHFEQQADAADPVFWNGSLPGYSLAWTEKS